jgi:IclR family acetate operon transcriptional repressor
LYRLLYTLQEHGFLVSVGEPQRFRLGPAVARLAHVWKGDSGSEGSLADPVLRRMWEETRETVAMLVPQGKMRLCVAELPSPQPLNFKRGVGYTERLVRVPPAAPSWPIPVTSAELRTTCKARTSS